MRTCMLHHIFANRTNFVENKHLQPIDFFNAYALFTQFSKISQCIGVKVELVHISFTNDVFCQNYMISINKTEGFYQSLKNWSLLYIGELKIILCFGVNFPLIFFYLLD